MILGKRKGKGSGQVKRRVWRVTEGAPLGEYVDASERSHRAPAHADDDGWLASSHELSSGVVVTDETDSIRGELFDQLFAKK